MKQRLITVMLTEKEAVAIVNHMKLTRTSPRDLEKFEREAPNFAVTMKERNRFVSNLCRKIVGELQKENK